MNDIENRRQQVFVRVRDFGQAHTSDFAPTSLGRPGKRSSSRMRCLPTFSPIFRPTLLLWKQPSANKAAAWEVTSPRAQPSTTRSVAAMTSCGSLMRSCGTSARTIRQRWLSGPARAIPNLCHAAPPPRGEAILKRLHQHQPPSGPTPDCKGGLINISVNG